MEYTTTTIQGKEVTVSDRDKKYWEKNTTQAQRNDPDFITDFGDNLKKKAETLESPKLELKISNQEQNVPEKSLQESSKSIYDFINESEFTKGRGNWRRNPTQEQLEKLNEVGHVGPRPTSSRKAFLLIAKHIRPTENSINFLNQLNYSGKSFDTEFEAINEIDRLRPPVKTQLEQIKELREKKVPQSYSEARDLILSLKDVTEKQKDKLNKHNIRNVPRNLKDYWDIRDQYENGTLIQPDPCPKCKGDKRFNDGEERDPCPYCNGSGNKEDFDEIKGDQIISDANQEHGGADDDEAEDMNDSEVESKTTDTPHDQGYGGWDLDKFR